MKKRNQIEEKYKWDLTQIYTCDEAMMESLKLIEKKVPLIEQYKGKLNNPMDLLSFYILDDEISKEFEKISAYAFFKYSEDISDPKYNEYIMQIENVERKFVIASSFYESEMLSLGLDYLNSIIQNKDFKTYKLGVQNLIRNIPHILSEAEEKIVTKVSLATSGYADIFDKIDNVDIVFKDAIDKNGKKHLLSHSNYIMLLESKDRALRKSAYENYMSAYKNLNNTIATNYISSVKKDWFYADIYKYGSVLESSLHSSNINKLVYEKLIENVNKHLNLLSNYYKYKKKALNLKKLEPWDLYVPTVKNANHFDYETCYEIVKGALSVLGDDYIEILDKAKQERWIDVYPSINKVSGAYQSDVYDVHPYVLLNSVDNINSVFTLAHEMGHAMHSYYSNKTQPYSLSNYPIFLAEIASTTNEILLTKYLINSAKNKQEKTYYLVNFIDTIKGTLFTQTMFSEFEYFAHTKIENNEPISNKLLNDYYGNLVLKYNGKNVSKNSLSGFSWTRIPHFYRAYYVYKYATGIVCAINFANDILTHGDNAVERYKEFLSSGGSDYPTNILKQHGIDLETDKPYDIVFKELEWAISELNK